MSARPSSPPEPPVSDVELPKHSGPRPGALSLLTPAQRGLTLAIIQADRCGRGGDDLKVLSSQFNAESDAALQLNTRISMAWSSFAPSAASLKR